jgi:hypothetical protein
MIKQTTIDRRKVLRRLWHDLGKKFLLMFGAGSGLAALIPRTRLEPLAYLVAFLVAFALSWIIMFRGREQNPLFKKGDD